MIAVPTTGAGVPTVRTTAYKSTLTEPAVLPQKHAKHNSRIDKREEGYQFN